MNITTRLSRLRWRIGAWIVPASLLAACQTDGRLDEPATWADVGAETPSPKGPAGTVRDYQVELPKAPPVDDRGYFQPPARDQLPEGPFGEAVRRGMVIFNDTPRAVPDLVGNDLACANCHLDQGRLANSAPMWAAWVAYPAYRRKNDRVNTMEDRIRGCFRYSMNAQASRAGQEPPAGHPALTDLQAYMYWLAQGAPTGGNLPGRGYPEPPEPEGGWDVTRGAAIYTEKCAICHGEDGQSAKLADGRVAFPPLWGERSYNWGAGMHRINTAAAFIQANMPLGQPGTLSDQEAWDVAAFINSHDRPPDPRNEGDLKVTDERFHDHACRFGESVEGETLGD